MTERYEIMLPISQLEADIAGAPIEVIERIVRAIGIPKGERLSLDEIARIGRGSDEPSTTLTNGEA